MFTGIIEEIGNVLKVDRGATSFSMTIQAKKIMEDIHLGDSIAVNGVCLTVTQFTNESFAVDVMPETYMATTLHKLSIGSSVNLERAMAANGRFGGHFVSGHVDGAGAIIEKKSVENALYLTIRVPSAFKQYLLEKGSIAIDGTSLTIFAVDECDVTISLVPHTQKETILAKKRIGEEVNVECDMFAKYVAQMFQQQKKQSEQITLGMLKENGFLTN